MSDAWVTTTLDRLLAGRHESGGWGYRADTSPAAEPTALSCMALSCHGVAPEACETGLQWLVRQQRDNGSVSNSTDSPTPTWATSLAALAWLRAPVATTQAYGGNVSSAINRLLRVRGKVLPLNRIVYGHDTTLVGWPWVDGTHSWVEPTSYAIRALREAGHHDHPRVREGVRLLMDRVLPDGGWNYGNTRIYESTLRPFPATTGIALFALTGAPREGAIERSLNYLLRTLPRIRAPWSLSWGVIGLSAWDAAPSECSSWLAEAAARVQARDGNTLDHALLLLAHAALNKNLRMNRDVART